jgi:hypothetical protein
LDFTKRNIASEDITMIKNVLQELSELGIITIANDSKYSFIYQLRYPINEYLILLKNEEVTKDKNLGLWLSDRN